MEYDVIIGLEIHAELKTKSKMFCACDNNAQDKAPNTVVCPICLGHPGTLPLPNRQAIEWTVLLGLALDGEINKLSKFDRKNYFYPDLPKGYQISQVDLPLVHHAKLDINGDSVEITRIHLEEDTGKNTHPAGKPYSLIDLNRAGTPLVELVTEPVIKSAEQAKKFCQRYQQVLRYLDISNADMEKGEMRCEANISVQEKGRWVYENGEIKSINDYRLNPKIEVKNINSFKAVEKAIKFEIERQIRALEEDEKLIQETRGWNEDKGQTISQRVKETSADYRYFPEPDIPPIKIEDALIESLRAGLPELPGAKKSRFNHEYGLNPDDAETLVADKRIADWFEEVVSELRAWIEAEGDSWERQNHRLSKTAANWTLSELFKHLKLNGDNIDNMKLTAENFAELVALVYQGKVNSSGGQLILNAMYQQGGDPTEIMKELNLEQIDDTDELEKTIRQVIAENKAQVDQYKSGKTSVLQFFIGKTMAATQGKANPKIVQELLTKLLNG